MDDMTDPEETPDEIQEQGPDGAADLEADPTPEAPVEAPEVDPRYDGSAIVLTLLTGRRPDLLDRTLSALQEHAPGLLETALVIVLHNGGDEETFQVLERYSSAINLWHTSESWLTIGQSMGELTELVREANPGGDRPYWLHLEDDWVLSGEQPDWLELARDTLARDPRTAQVRLRTLSQPCLPHHMVTRAPLRWFPIADGVLEARDAHWTNNPSLTRVAHARDAYPAQGERSAQRRWHRAGRRRTAQLDPGAFHHIGEGRSAKGQPHV